KGVVGGWRGRVGIELIETDDDLVRMRVGCSRPRHGRPESSSREVIMNEESMSYRGWSRRTFCAAAIAATIPGMMGRCAVGAQEGRKAGASAADTKPVKKGDKVPVRAALGQVPAVQNAVDYGEFIAAVKSGAPAKVKALWPAKLILLPIGKVVT